MDDSSWLQPDDVINDGPCCDDGSEMTAHLVPSPGIDWSILGAAPGPSPSIETPWDDFRGGSGQERLDELLGNVNGFDGTADTTLIEVNEDVDADLGPPRVVTVPIDSVVSDVLSGVGSTGHLIDNVLDELPPSGGFDRADGGVPISSEIGGTLDFINSNGSMISGLINDIESGRDFSGSDLEWGNRKIDSGGNNGFWDAINRGNEISNEIRHDQLDEMDEAQRHRAEYNLWKALEDAKRVIDESATLHQRNRDDLGL